MSTFTPRRAARANSSPEPTVRFFGDSMEGALRALPGTFVPDYSCSQFEHSGHPPVPLRLFSDSMFFASVQLELS